MRAAVLLLTLSLLLAGCMGNESVVDDRDLPTDDGDGGPGGGATDEEGPPTVEAPAWDVGQWWSYRIQTQFYPEDTARMVYYEDAGDNYMVGIDKREQALRHAVFNVNPILGRIQKGNLALYEDGTPRAVYRFPMTDGTTWQTDLYRGTLNDAALNARATYDPAIQVGDTTYEGFTIQAVPAGGNPGNSFTVTFDYVPAIQWFTHYEVTDPDEGLIIRMDLEDFGTDHQGTAWFMRGADVYPKACGVEGNYTPDDMGPDGSRTDTCFLEPKASHQEKYGMYDYLAFNVQISLEEEGVLPTSVTIRDPDDQQVYGREFGELGTSQRFDLRTTDGFEPGEWDFQYRVDGEGWARVRAAGVYEYSATLP